MDSYTLEAPPDNLRVAYGIRRLLLYAAAAVVLAVLIAGFWNYQLVDGFGRDVVAGSTIGDTAELAGSYATRGAGFGFIFAAIAGLAATFTACNCVVFAMIPGLACSTDQKGHAVSPWRALGAFVAGVTVVCAVYGVFVGLLGSEGIAALNERGVRLPQAQAVFTVVGAVMLAWGFIELGFFDAVTSRLSPGVRSFFAAPATKAAILGLLVGLFAVGRPFPVFREFMAYAASAQSPLYGAGVMAVQGLGQILVMMLLFSLMVALGGRRLMQWAGNKPHQPRLFSGLALLAGGAFFVFYWGLAFFLDIGRWGFKLGWY
jgi:sulfite exporter TauE/SafE